MKSLVLRSFFLTGVVEEMSCPCFHDSELAFDTVSLAEDSVLSFNAEDWRTSGHHGPYLQG